MLATLLLTSFLFYSASGQCLQSTDKYIGDLCYTISNQKLNFQDARSYCHGSASNLGVIHTSLQANFLASFVRTQTGAPEGLFYIGLSRQAVGSRFQWDDGTAMYWSNFDSNFPQDNNFAAESTVNGKWRTLDGIQPLYFVCSYDPNHATPGTSQQPTSSSPWPESTAQPSSSAASTGYPTTSSDYPSTSYGSTTLSGSTVSQFTTITVSSDSTASTTSYDVSSTAYPSTIVSTAGSSVGTTTQGSTYGSTSGTTSDQ